MVNAHHLRTFSSLCAGGGFKIHTCFGAHLEGTFLAQLDLASFIEGLTVLKGSEKGKEEKENKPSPAHTVFLQSEII